MRKFVTKLDTKRKIAAALATAKDRNKWTNDDLGDMLGCVEGTVRLRLDDDDPHNQMTVYELLRSIVNDTGIANDILELVGFRLIPLGPAPETCDRRKASSITRAGAAVSEMLEDGEITDDEIRDRRADLENALYGIKELLARIRPRVIGEKAA